MARTAIGTPYKRYDGTRDFDVIVIGSGIGGLTAASLLARRAKKRALVLERHYVAGGFTHTFQRPGFEWDVGVHYIGDVGEPTAELRILFDHLTDGELQWASLGDVYDRIVLGDRAYDYVAGRDAWRARMHEYFPNDTEAIDRYIETVRDTIRQSRLYFAEKAMPGPIAALLGGRMRRGFQRYSDRTVAEVLDEITDNAELRAVLTGQFGDYGLPPRQASFVIHAMVTNHYFKGAFYPIGGAGRMAETIVPGIERVGGQVLTSAEVAEVLVERDRTAGVRMTDGSEFRAPVVISDAGLATTVRRLLPEGTRGRDRLEAVLQRLQPSVGHVCLYLGLDATDEELGLQRPNLWLYPGNDFDANVADYTADPEAELPVVYVSFPSAKDPDFGRRHPGKATIDVIGLAPYEWFADWGDARWKHRGDTYEAQKAALTERLLQVLERHVPSVRGHIVHRELSTPVTTRHFANYERGELYGLAHTPARFAERDLRPRTKLPGFWLTGQDICSAGVGGALMGGVITASAMLRRDLAGSLVKQARARLREREAA